MNFRNKAKHMALYAALFLGVIRCMPFTPMNMEEVPFRERAQTQQKGEARVTAAVLGAEESKRVFGAPLYDKLVQPIWLEIENKGEDPLWFLPASVDREYFAPLEVAYMYRSGFSKEARGEMAEYFYDRAMGMYIPPRSVRSGFVFTQLDEGTKAFNLELVTEDHELLTFTFFIPVPGLSLDYERVDWDRIYSRDAIVTLDEEGLRKALEELPRCTTNKDGSGQGDPLNLAVIGDLEDVYYAFIRSGWDETETITASSAWKTASSFSGVGRYRYSPISALYVFQRPQDVAFQKARKTIHERNHLRLWLTPMRCKGKRVFIGQISRDIGVKFAAHTIITHKIDPDVDEARSYLLQDLWYSTGLRKYAYVKGVGPAPISAPRQNLGKDDYFTDGHRLVLWVTREPVALKDVQFVEWEFPPER